MKRTNLFFHSNIRFLRDRKKYTQEEVAADLQFTRNKLQALESGKTRNPVAEDLVAFSDYFDVSIDSLMRVNLPDLGEFKLKELLAGNDVYMTGTNIRVLAITVDKQNRENTEYVPVKAKAGYESGYNDPQYIASLPRFTLPNLPSRGTFRMFPTVGDSMLPIPEGSDVIAEYVQDWKSIKAGTPAVVVLKGFENFVFKMVTVLETGKIILQSLNQLYAPYEVKSEDVIEIWKYFKHQTNTLPEPDTELKEIKNLLLSMKEDLKK